MSTDLAVTGEENNLPDLQNPYDADFEKVALGSSFLPRIQLYGSNSDAVKTGKVPMNHYGLVTKKDEIQSLGAEVDVYPIAWRPRALDTSDRANIRASSDTKSALWREIQDRADNVTNSGCQYGPEYLVWVPSLRLYATFLMGNKSARVESRQMHGRLQNKDDNKKDKPLPVTLRSKLLSNPQYKWQAPLITDCSTPIDMPTDMEELLTIRDKFLHPPEQAGAEKVTEGQQRNR